MKIAIGVDHAGFEQKDALVSFMKNLGHEILDMGCNSTDKVDYPDFAEAVGRSVASGQAEVGILICGTGIGMSIAANKIPGIRAANVVRADMASLARQHNDSNVLTLSSRFVDVEDNKRIIDAFLKAEFEGGRHEDRVKKIMALES